MNIRNLLQKFVFALLAVMLMTGWGWKKDINAEQVDFVRKIRVLSSELEKIRTNAIVGKLNLGHQLPPKDLDEKLEIQKKVATDFLDSTQPIAVLWKAEITSLRREGDLIIIGSNYENQFYYLKIFDSKAKEIAERFSKEDKITFSGKLGRETSITLWGALKTPEFILYPTLVRNKSAELSQSAESIQNLVESEKRLFEAQKAREKHAVYDDNVGAD